MGAKSSSVKISKKNMNNDSNKNMKRTLSIDSYIYYKQQSKDIIVTITKQDIESRMRSDYNEYYNELCNIKWNLQHNDNIENIDQMYKYDIIRSTIGFNTINYIWKTFTDYRFALYLNIIYHFNKHMDFIDQSLEIKFMFYSDENIGGVMIGKYELTTDKYAYNRLSRFNMNSKFSIYPLKSTPSFKITFGEDHHQIPNKLY